MAHDSTIEQTLYIAFELSLHKWVLACSDGNKNENQKKPKQFHVKAGAFGEVLAAVEKAKCAFKMEGQVHLVSCYEAGRDGFWLHRWLTTQGWQNYVLDSASIEVPRRGRRAKTDRLDANGLLRILIRLHGGEKEACSVVSVPSEQDEDERRLHRNRERLLNERTRHVNRIKADLITQGVSLKINDKFEQNVEKIIKWDGQPLPAHLLQMLKMEYQRFVQVEEQIDQLEKQQEEFLAQVDNEKALKIAYLMKLKSVGSVSAWTLVMEFFGWRKFQNRKQVGALAGLVDTPYDSGTSQKGQGISKSGNRRIRTLMVELAWQWIRWQGGSQLTQWYQAKFAAGGKKVRKLGAVALARKLLIALWHYVEHGVVPQGAIFKKTS